MFSPDFNIQFSEIFMAFAILCVFVLALFQGLKGDLFKRGNNENV